MNKEELQNNYVEMLILDLEKHSFDYWESTQDEMVEALRNLQQQNKKYKEVIDKAIEYLEVKRIREKSIVDTDVLIGILKEVK